MLRAYFLTGVVGDAALQMINAHSTLGNRWGLDTYFAQHGVGESLFIAGGLMVGSSMVAERAGITTMTGLFAFGFALDLAFRYGRLFPSLDDYYRKQDVITSAVWGGIPMIIPLMITP